jgi:plasmid stabilization system protein ParE
MYVVFILEEALEDLTTIVAHISAENVAAAETLVNELIDEAMSLELMPYRGSVVKKQPALRKLQSCPTGQRWLSATCWTPTRSARH